MIRLISGFLFGIASICFAQPPAKYANPSPETFRYNFDVSNSENYRLYVENRFLKAFLADKAAGLFDIQVPSASHVSQLVLALEKMSDISDKRNSYLVNPACPGNEIEKLKKKYALTGLKIDAIESTLILSAVVETKWTKHSPYLLRTQIGLTNETNTETIKEVFLCPTKVFEDYASP